MRPTAVAPLLERQRDLMTYAQAREGGLTDAAIRWAVSRHWHVVLPRVLHVVRAPLSREQRLIAALLYAGDDAAIGGLSAASWYGLRHADDGGVVRVLVPRTSRSRDLRWVRVRRTRVPYEHRVSGAIRLVPPERAVVDAAREAQGPERAEGLVIEAVQRRIVRLDDLASMNSLLGLRWSALAERAIRSAAGGAWSVPEAGLYRLVSRSATLPEMWCNPVLKTSGGLRLLSPDGWFDDVGLAVMVHSRTWHDGQRWDGTVERDGDLVAHDVRVLPLAPTSIEREPARVLARIEQTYRAALRSGRTTDVVATRQTVR
ncbi:MAG: hypothetical protein M9891_02920 [Austwickia sp.]|nr:hypothetical protein [Austwickia sp.]MCO5308243.1 hypothetical protein [Austwickia sp.]